MGIEEGEKGVSDVKREGSNGERVKATEERGTRGSQGNGRVKGKGMNVSVEEK